MSRSQVGDGARIRAVILDLDGTLAPGDSFSDALAGLRVPAAALAALHASNSAGTLVYDDARVRVLDLLTSTGRAQRGMFEEILTRRPLHGQAAAIVRDIGASGLSVGISSTMNLYVQIVAAQLGIADYAANLLLHFDAAGHLRDVSFDPDTAGLKHRQLKRFCQRHAVDFSQVAVIGDGENDVAMFQATGLGILVRHAGNAQLAWYAWRTVPGLAEAGALLCPMPTHVPRGVT